jgi:hypothetical protein
VRGDERENKMCGEKNVERLGRFKEVCDPEDGLRFIRCFKSRNMDEERERRFVELRVEWIFSQEHV